ncbi:hypothetical protein BX616_004633 [Lobosporangium transversale]|uniref:GST N-terminal domain-containing protein n=1 Tax=Lobosporangium transversale TaxID=64571 RepID=A0A1Y2G7X9_9FUNG|nr:hypothetical protein BCR41DRAFT_364214 [Lobosporangium transversale]KAF9916100.1 hypothetical protein BX616_004633 [Lobosporangium transversale]ORY98365.1 hypothetical protein BCR41DRAFT_364214 [Lobosporangium transversale]|eukprot:XP_021875757.1 hypothetical protein BCR41DRAFT_364214 [Lobosporangium transversale]
MTSTVQSPSVNNSNKSGFPRLFILNRNYSSWSLRAWLALRILKVDFETEVLIVGTPDIPDLGSPAANKLMLRAGPTAKVPALHVDKGTGDKHIVFESLAIMEYLAEDYPHLWPSDRFDRAYARSLAAEMATGFGAIRNYAMNLRENRDFDPEMYNDSVQKNILRLSNIWEELRSKAVGEEGDEGYLFGRFTALDAMYAPIMFRLRSYGLRSKVQGKNASAYVEWILNNEYMKEWEEHASHETEIIPSDELYEKK